MNWKRLLTKMYTEPNGPKGLIIRAEQMEECAENERTLATKESYLLYAKGLRAIASKNLSPTENKKLVRVLRGRG